MWVAQRLDHPILWPLEIPKKHILPFLKPAQEHLLSKYICVSPCCEKSLPLSSGASLYRYMSISTHPAWRISPMTLQHTKVYQPFQRSFVPYLRRLSLKRQHYIDSVFLYVPILKLRERKNLPEQISIQLKPRTFGLKPFILCKLRNPTKQEHMLKIHKEFSF